MHSILHRVPRLQPLAVFECAARLRSFTAAAAALGLTQSGVSRQISALERSLGQPLFDRSANSVELNSTGMALFAAVREAFDVVEHCLDNIATDPDTFLLAVNPGYAQVWLVPFLDSLQRALGDVRLRLQFFDRESELDGDDFDAAIHLTLQSAVSAASVKLFDETTVPVASPEFARMHALDRLSPPSALLDVELLYLDGRQRRWMGWEAWFAANDLIWTPKNTSLSYNNHALVMEDALAGRGVALGWIGLVDAALDTDRLVEVGPRRSQPGSGHFLIPGRRASRELFDRLHRWLLTPDERDSDRIPATPGADAR